jgi:hypothetical protein
MQTYTADENGRTLTGLAPDERWCPVCSGLGELHGKGERDPETNVIVRAERICPACDGTARVSKS